VFQRAAGADAGNQSDASGEDMQGNRKAAALKTAAVCAALLLAACGDGTTAAATAVPTGGPPQLRGYVLNNVYVAAPPEEPGACPQLSRNAPELFRATLPAAEQARYAGIDQQEALFKRAAQHFGFLRTVVKPDPETRAIGPQQIAAARAQLGLAEGKGGLNFLGKVVAYDSCTNPEDFPQLDAGLMPYAGSRAIGINLDGRADTGGFTSPGGEPGVDNSLWRMFGCIKGFRETGSPELAAKATFSARAPTLLEIGGVDDLRNDPEVEVAVYTGTTPLVTGANGTPLARASFDVDPDPRLQSRVRGRIADGVLTTEPFDLRLSFKEQIVDTVRELRGSRLRATLKPDGSIDGGIYGYYDIASAWDSIQQMTEAGAMFTGFSCPAVRSALQRHADGFPDPKTGRNTAISTALGFAGVRAHIIHSPARPSLAAADAPARPE